MKVAAEDDGAEPTTTTPMLPDQRGVECGVSAGETETPTDLRLLPAKVGSARVTTKKTTDEVGDATADEVGDATADATAKAERPEPTAPRSDSQVTVESRATQVAAEEVAEEVAAAIAPAVVARTPPETHKAQKLVLRPKEAPIVPEQRQPNKRSPAVEAMPTRSLQPPQRRQHRLRQAALRQEAARAATVPSPAG